MSQYELRDAIITALPIMWHKPTLFPGCNTHHLAAVANSNIIPFVLGWDMLSTATRLYPLEEVIIRENYNDSLYILSIGF